MKENNKNIEKRIENTIVALDNIKKARPRPFLYARIMARMDNTNVKHESFYISPFLRYATISIIILIVFFNIFTASQFLGTTPLTENIDSEIGELQQEYYSEVITIDNLENYINE